LVRGRASTAAQTYADAKVSEPDCGDLVRSY